MTKSNVEYRQKAIEMTQKVIQDRGTQWDRKTQQEDNFQAIAKVWSVIMRHRLNSDFTPRDIAKMMTAFKIIRDGQSETEDNLLDMAGYAIIGLACGLAEKENNMPLEFNFDSLHPNEVTPPEFDTILPIDDAPPAMYNPPNVATDYNKNIEKIREKKVWDKDRWADDGGINYDSIANHIAENKWKQYDVLPDNVVSLPKWIETKIGNLEVKSDNRYFDGDTIYPPHGEHNRDTR